ncbi:hypothetical protein CPC08DRAFT_728600 [Agrocybe pediades]|nr:hypothetical protein CPC08DRAFT_728600 [Agrocybe pediades]
MVEFNPSLYVRAVQTAGQRVYNATERAIIDGFQEEYRSACSAAQRRQVIVQHVCPKLFQYWQEECGSVIEDHDVEGRVKVLLAYVRNCWRPSKSTRKNQPTFVVKRSNVVWDTMQDRVMAEIAKLMGLEYVDTNTKGWFSKRMSAIGNIIKQLSDDEKVALDAEVQRRMDRGNPDNVKVKLAKKHRFSRISDAARRNYLEMGLLSLNFVAYKDDDGVYGLDIHDDMHTLLGVEDTSFEMESPQLVVAFKRQVLARLKHLIAKKEGEALPQDTSAHGYNHYLEIDRATGFPWLKDTFRTFVKPKKMVEKLFRRYLSLQYLDSDVATGRHDPVPYSKVLVEIGTFIEPQYLPTRFKFRDPRNVNADEIHAFFEHIFERQQFCPIDNVFRFKKVTKTRNGGDIIGAPYPPLPTTFHGANAAAGPMDAKEVAPDRMEKCSRTEINTAKKKQPTIGQIVDMNNLYSLSPTSRDTTLPPSTAPAVPITPAKGTHAREETGFTEDHEDPYNPSPTLFPAVLDTNNDLNLVHPPLDPFIINESRMQIQNAQFQPVARMPPSTYAVSPATAGRSDYMVPSTNAVPAAVAAHSYLYVPPPPQSEPATVPGEEKYRAVFIRKPRQKAEGR